MDSGSIDAVYHMKALQELGYRVTFIPDDLIHRFKYTQALQRIDITCLHAPGIKSIENYLEVFGKYYDLIMLTRVHCAAKYIATIRASCGRAKVLFNTVDLHHLREERQAMVEKSAQLARSAEATKALEYMVMEHSDATIVISEVEQHIIHQERPEVRVMTIPFVREVLGCRLPYQERKDIVFIGGFRHAPNVDAVVYFLGSIWPSVHMVLPDVHFRIVGSHITEAVKLIAQEPGVIVDGYIQDLATVLDQCRLSVAPLRYGAGIKGKVGTSLCYGLPCVATPEAAEGMGLSNGQEVLIASDAASFSAAVIEAYQNEALWNRISNRGLEFMQRHYSFGQSVERFRNLIDSIPPKPKAS
jgi:O-antigen biosynthesis protein